MWAWKFVNPPSVACQEAAALVRAGDGCVIYSRFVGANPPSSDPKAPPTARRGLHLFRADGATRCNPRSCTAPSPARSSATTRRRRHRVLTSCSTGRPGRRTSPPPGRRPHPRGRPPKFPGSGSCPPQCPTLGVQTDASVALATSLVDGQIVRLSPCIPPDRGAKSWLGRIDFAAMAPRDTARLGGPRVLKPSRGHRPSPERRRGRRKSGRATAASSSSRCTQRSCTAPCRAPWTRRRRRGVLSSCSTVTTTVGKRY